MPYLLHGGCSALDMALVTHLHEDHYRGISELSEVFPIGAVGIPSDYREIFSGGTEEPLFRTEQLYPAGPGSRITVSDDVQIDVIWPVGASSSAISADDPNEHNTVYMITYKGVKVMVTGDLLEEDELEMVRHYRSRNRTDMLRCDILKVAHHGSRSSSSETFLDAASPSIAVIQAGRNNIYGHPHRQTLDRLEERGIAVYRTDLNGTVGIDIRRNRLKVDVMHPSG
jgi:competence protein ComEC